MLNPNNVLDLLVEALREGGETRLREFAKTYATDNLGEVNEEALTEILNEIIAALNDFDKAAAINVLEGAEDRLRAVEEDEEEEEDEDDVDAEAENLILADRVTALEKTVAELRSVATSRGLL